MEYPDEQSPTTRGSIAVRGLTSAALAKKHRSHRVLGEEAARRTDWDDLENVVVDVEITDWPTATQNPRGRVVEILGYEDDFGVDVEIIIRKFHLPHRFPPEVLDEAQANRARHSRELKLASGATSAIFQSSPSTAKPPATSTTPLLSVNWKMATTNCRSTSRTSRNM